MNSRRGFALTLLGATSLVSGTGENLARADIALTADEVAARTRDTSATLAARRSEIQAAKAAVSEARVALWPRLAALGFYSRYSPITAPTLGNVVAAQSPGPVDANNLPAAIPLRFAVVLNSMGAQVSGTIPASDYLFRFPHTIAGARRGLDAAQAQHTAADNAVWFDGRSLYYSWARAVLEKGVTDIAVDQARAHLDHARSQEGAGTGLSTEAVRFESQLANAELLQRRLANLIDLLADQLRTSMHDSRPGHYILGETFDGERQEPGPVEFEACLRQALSHRAELPSLSALALSEKAQAKAATASMYPHLDLYGLGLESNPNPRYLPAEDKFHLTWEIGARLSYSPNEIALARTQSRQHDARAESLLAQRQQMEESIRSEVLAAVQAREEAALALVAAKKSLALAEDSLRVRRSLLTEGRSTAVEVTDAETELVRARFAEVGARIDVRLAANRLQRTMGTAD